MAGVVTKGLIGKEDLTLGTGTSTRATSTGGTVGVTQIPISIVGGNLTLLGTSTATLNASTISTSTLNNCTLNTCTSSVATLVSPTINGTPSGTGIQTVTLKKGTGAGNYTGSNTSYADVDATNLSLTVTIPSGWKLFIQFNGEIQSTTAAAQVFYSLFDTQPNATLVEASVNTTNSAISLQASLGWMITGDGNSHTIKLQAKTGNGADAWDIVNASATRLPTMLFILSPSN